MTVRVERGRSGGVEITLGDLDLHLLTQVVSEVLALLDEGAEALPDDPLAAAVGIGSATRAPTDPALARLLPDAYPEDPEASAEFRRYTETGLRDRKRTAARTLLATLGEPDEAVVLDPAQAQAWLTALNDVRLALGTRIGVTEELEELLDTLDEDDPALYAFAVYDYLTGLQESLVQALW